MWSYHSNHVSPQEAFVGHVSHPNATLTPRRRLDMARLVVEQGWTYAMAAERFMVGTTTVRRWVGRYRVQGEAGMLDRSSRPRRSPHQLPRRVERRIVGLRVSRRWGPARIAYHLRLNPSTVHKVLVRYGCPKLRWTDPATGARTKTLDKRRYTHPAPGDLVHIDIKKLGRIPRGGGWKKTGRVIGNRHNKRERPGYAFLHHAVDDHSRLAYSEILTDERKETAAEFWLRAKAFFAAHGITVTAVLTDNGACYRSKLFGKTLTGAGIKHRFTRPYRPQTNGKVERFNRTLLEEWAYATTYTSEEARAAAYPAWLHYYNHHRGHTAHKGQPPIAFVPNLPGSNS